MLTDTVRHPARSHEFMNTLHTFVPFFMGVSILSAEPATLPETTPLVMTGDLSTQMHEAAIRGIDAQIEASLASRARLWRRDISSAQNYEGSIRENREHLKKIIGVGDPRVPVTMDRFGA